MTAVKRFTLVIALAACATGKAERMRAVPASTPVAELPIHSDYARLLPFRSYYRLVSVGPFAHHFEIGYSDVEAGFAEFEVVRTKDGFFPREIHGGFPWSAPSDASTIPASLRPAAEAARRELLGMRPWVRILSIIYLGEYREVVALQLRPAKASVPVGWFAEIRFAADEALTKLERPLGVMRGEGSGCISDGCHAAPRWIGGPSSVGLERGLVALSNAKGSPSLGDAILSEARRTVANEPPLPMTADADGARLVPAGFNQEVRIVLTAAAQRTQGPGKPDLEALAVPIRVRDLAAGHARGHAEARWLGVRVDAEVELIGPAPLPAPRGDKSATYELTVRVHDERGNAFGFIYPAVAKLLVEGDDVGLLGLGIQVPHDSSGQGIAAVHVLPGAGDFYSIEVRLQSSVDTRD
jgi:hypothetical protein